MKVEVCPLCRGEAEKAILGVFPVWIHFCEEREIPTVWGVWSWIAINLSAFLAPGRGWTFLVAEGGYRDDFFWYPKALLASLTGDEVRGEE